MADGMRFGRARGPRNQRGDRANRRHAETRVSGYVRLWIGAESRAALPGKDGVPLQ